MNKILRGKGKSPSVVNSEKVSSVLDLKTMVESSKFFVKELKTFPKHCHFNHPYFGVLHLNFSLKFLNIYTHHHLKIIKEIVQF